MSSKSTLTNIASFAMAVSLTTSVQAALVTHLEDISVNGVLYDVVFHAGIRSFNDVYDENNDGILGDGLAGHAPTFTSQAEAEAAATAVRTALGDADWTADQPGFGFTDQFLITFDHDGDNHTFVLGDGSVNIATDLPSSSTQTIADTFLHSGISPFATFIQATAVPAPTSLALMVAGLFGLGMVRRRRSKY